MTKTRVKQMLQIYMYTHKDIWKLGNHKKKMFSNHL